MFHEVGWYMTLYFVGAYLRLYAGTWAHSVRFAARWLLVLVPLSWASIVAIDLLGHHLHKWDWFKAFYFFGQSSQILAFLMGVAIFLFFLNVHIPQSRFINNVAKTVFGILLIHAHSDAMRHWLWGYFFDVPAMYDAPMMMLVLHAVGSLALVFAVCSALDWLRICYLERPLMRWIYAHSDVIEVVARRSFGRLRIWTKKIE